MSSNHLVGALRDLIDLGPDAFSGPHTNAFVEAVGRQHPAGTLYKKATAEAIACTELSGVCPEDVAAEVYANFIWTHFVCKLLMTAAPMQAARFAQTHFDMSEPVSAVEACGASILSCFHYSGYPLVALGVAVSPLAPLITKARVDIMEHQAPDRLGDQVVYLSDRSAGVRLTRALKQGKSVWVMLDVVLPSVRTIKTRLLGVETSVGAGVGTLALLSGRPCIPLSWELQPGKTKLHTGAPVLTAERSEEAVIQEFVTSQAAFIAEHPAQWLEWYSVLDEAPRIRAEVKRGNEEVWACLAHAL